MSSRRLLLFAATLLAASCEADTPPPVIQTATELRATVGARVQLDASGSFDRRDLPLTFEWAFVALPVGSRATLNDLRVRNPSFVADVPGTFILKLLLRNGRTAPAEASVRVDVSPCGTGAPTVTAVDIVPVPPSVGDTIQLRADVTDPDAAAPCSAAPEFTYEWTFVLLPRGSRAALNDTRVRNPSFVADMPGRYEVRVVAIDAQGLRSAPYVQAVSVSECGAGVPVATPRATPASPTIGELVQLAVDVVDADTGPNCGRTELFSYDWALVAAPLGSRTELVGASLSTPWFEADVSGRYVARVVVTDTLGLRSAPAFVTVDAGTCGGASPSATVIAPTSSNLGSLIALAALVTDADTQPPCSRAERFRYAWSFQQVPGGSAVRFSDPTLAAPSFAGDVPGTYVVALTVTDAVGHRSEPATARIDVSACGGNRPSATVSATPSTPAVGSTVQLRSTVTDADIACGIAESFSYQWRFDGLPPGSRSAFNNDALAGPSFVPDLPGLYAVRLTVTDASGRASAPTIFSINVAACGNSAPVGSIEVGTPSPRIGAPVALSASVVDADALPPCNLPEYFTYAWSFETLPAGSVATLNNPSARTPSFTPDVAGEFVLRLAVEDAGGNTSPPALARVVVSACGGAAPVVGALSASTSNPGVGQAVRLSASVTDADNAPGCALGQLLSYTWQLTSLPAGSAARLNSTAAETPSFVPDIAGDYRVELLVTDSTGRASNRAALTVAANVCGSNRPTAGITMISPSVDLLTPSYVATGATVQLDGVTSADADNAPPCSLGQALSYQWVLFVKPASSSSTLAPETSRTPTFRADASGQYLVQLRVSDGQNTSAVTTFEINACSPFPNCAP